MKHGGFSIVEIVITVAILSILLTLGVVSMNGSQINARDSERKSDVQSIAIHFESYYKNAMSGGGPLGSSEYFMSGGTYPGTSYMYQDFFDKAVPEADRKIFRAPGVDKDQPVSIVASSNTLQTTSGVQPQPTTSTYVYQAIQENGTSLCADPFINGACRKFNIFYRLEKDSSVQMITSKNQ